MLSSSYPTPLPDFIQGMCLSLALVKLIVEQGYVEDSLVVAATPKADYRIVYRTRVYCSSTPTAKDMPPSSLPGA
jgi:hypothetical protein